jgi:hypothetical protein
LNQASVVAGIAKIDLERNDVTGGSIVRLENRSS